MFFENRVDAGQKLAGVFTKVGEDWTGWQVIGLARGGVITAVPVAQALELPMLALCVDDFDTNHGRFVITGLKYFGLFYAKSLSLGPDFSSFSYRIASLRKIEGFSEFHAQLRAKQEAFNCGEELVIGEKVIVVDDGLASGKSAFTAIEALKVAGAKQIVLAVPVVLPWLMKKDYGFLVVTWRVSKLANAPTGMFYYNFEDTPDEDVVEAVMSCRYLTPA